MTLLTYAALDLIYEPIGTTVPIATNYLIGGAEIGERYMNVNYGGSATAANTGFLDGGIDISDILTQKGTVLPGITWLSSGNGWMTGYQDDTNSFAQAKLSFNSNGSITKNFVITPSIDTAPTAWLDAITTGDGARFEGKYETPTGASATSSTWTVNTWQQMNVTRSLTVTRNDAGTSTDPNDGCDNITNGASLAGKIVVIRRGDCEFGVKAFAAETEGAETRPVNYGVNYIIKL